jgi:hypothetical protein
LIDFTARIGRGFDEIVLIVRQLFDAIPVALMGTPWSVIIDSRSAHATGDGSRTSRCHGS